MFLERKTTFFAFILSAAITNQVHATDLTVQKNEVPVVGKEKAVSVISAPAAAPVVKPMPVAVLDRFRAYTGLRTPAVLSELFKAPVFIGVRQQPEVVLTTGAETLGVSIALSGNGDSAPNVAFNGARMLSSAKTGKEEWFFDILPEAGALHAEVIVLTASGVVEIPLTVAPALPEGIDITEKGFASFLGGKDAVKPQLDVNGDGHKDYLDDYIFTANYIVRKRSPLTDTGAITAPQTPAGMPGTSTDDGEVAAPIVKEQSPVSPTEENSLQFSGGWGGQAPPMQQSQINQQETPISTGTSNSPGTSHQTGTGTPTPAVTPAPALICDNTNLHDLRCRNQRARNWSNRLKQ